MDFPAFLYRSDGDSFLCPDEEFYDSLTDQADWGPDPYTGDRTVLLDANQPACANCRRLMALVAQLQAQLQPAQLKPYKSSFAKKIEAKQGA